MFYGSVEAFRKGCPKAFGQLYRMFRKPLLSYVQMRVRDRAAAEDITQEVFIKAFRFRALYEPGRQMSSWLRAIARNATSDWLRRQRPEDPHGESEVFACAKPNAESLLAEVGERARLRNAMKSLTEQQRQVLLLRVVHQLSYAEISRKLGVTASAAKCLAYRAKTALIASVGMSPSLARA
jgi:RNA polymerase sigma-70 factor (ECF subfamily)